VSHRHGVRIDSPQCKKASSRIPGTEELTAKDAKDAEKLLVGTTEATEVTEK
jgi:hypothetical protein